MNRKKYIIISAIILVCIIGAPPILSVKGKYIAFGEAAAHVGDTIGGTTAPIVGIASILLLALTLTEQTNFNKKQLEFNNNLREFNDYGILMKLVEQINTLSENIIIIKHKDISDENIKYNGINYIDELPSLNSNYIIETEDLGKMYYQIVQITELCLFLSKFISESTLKLEIKEALKMCVSNTIIKSIKFFDLFRNGNINIPHEEQIDGNVDDDLIEEDFFHKYQEESTKLYERLNQIMTCK